MRFSPLCASLALVLSMSLVSHRTAHAGGSPDSSGAVGFRLSPFGESVAAIGGGRTPTAAFGDLRFRFESDGAIAPKDGPTSTRVSTRFALERGIARRAYWFGVGAERRTHAGRSTAGPTLEAGARTRATVLDLSVRARFRTVLQPIAPELVSIRTYPDGQPLPDTIPPITYWQTHEPAPRSATSFDVGASWGTAPWTFAIGAGIGVGSDFAPVWEGRAHVQRHVRQGVELAAGVDYGGASWLSDDFLEGPRFVLGIQLEPMKAFARSPDLSPEPPKPPPASWKVACIDQGLCFLSVRNAEAGTVELRGDFTAWQSVSLRRSSDDWWEVALPMTAGTHQVEIRVDGGAWRPPDSLVAVEGAYGDRVGMFVIE